MNYRNLTLLIPAKFESSSLPKVLEEIKNFKCKVLIVLEQTDYSTIKAIKKFDVKILYQKNKGYGSALIEGIKNISTKYLCIFNADGSFDPKSLGIMLKKCKNKNFVFASRYKKNGGSDDDTLLTLIGNYIFTNIGKFFFKLKISDILFTYVLGQTNSFKELALKSKDFCFCVELPIKIEKYRKKYTEIASKERSRIAGLKKVNEFKDGFKILIYMIKMYLNV